MSDSTSIMLYGAVMWVDTMKVEKYCKRMKILFKEWPVLIAL